MTTLRAIVAVFMVVFGVLCLVDSIKGDGLPSDPEPTTPTTPIYPLGHPPTNCAEYIGTNTYHEGC
jgi:hypothetical protein